MRAKKRILITILILCNFVLQVSIPHREFIPVSNGGGINSDANSPLFITDPITFDNEQENLQTETESDNKKAINDFISTVADGTSGIIRGIYAENNFALQIIQQPSGQSGFVSKIEGEVTQFSMATNYGITGLLAHNYLSGRHFFKLGKGDVIQLVYGDGNLVDYQISEIQRYQALQPNSPIRRENHLCNINSLVIQ